MTEHIDTDDIEPDQLPEVVAQSMYTHQIEFTFRALPAHDNDNQHTIETNLADALQHTPGVEYSSLVIIPHGDTTTVQLFVNNIDNDVTLDILCIPLTVVLCNGVMGIPVGCSLYSIGSLGSKTLIESHPFTTRDVLDIYAAELEHGDPIVIMKRAIETFPDASSVPLEQAMGSADNPKDVVLSGFQTFADSVCAEYDCSLPPDHVTDQPPASALQSYKADAIVFTQKYWKRMVIGAVVAMLIAYVLYKQRRKP